MNAEHDREFMTEFVQWFSTSLCDYGALFATYERVARAGDRYERANSRGTADLWLDLGGEG